MGAKGDSIKIKFWGVRGSIPTPGPSTVRFGGNTPCVEVRCGGRLLIFDGGSGLRLLGKSLRGEDPIEGSIFFSHLHWDHIQGIPFFEPAFQKDNCFHIYGPKRFHLSLERVLSGQMEFPHFPVSLDQLGAKLFFNELHDGSSLDLEGVAVKAALVNHPGGSLSYRVEYRSRVLVYASDAEYHGSLDDKFVRHVQGANCLIFDTTYTDDEYSGKRGKSHKGWGHSTWQDGVRIAKAASVGRLVLYHHEPNHDDDFIEAVEAMAKKEFPGAIAAREGLELIV